MNLNLAHTPNIRIFFQHDSLAGNRADPPLPLIRPACIPNTPYILRRENLEDNFFGTCASENNFENLSLHDLFYLDSFPTSFRY